jgi:hypothetical protein
MVQLHRQHALDLVNAEQRPAGADQPSGLGVGAILVGELGQPGAEVWIDGRIQRPPLFGEMAGVVDVLDIGAACQLVVDQLRGRYRTLDRPCVGIRWEATTSSISRVVEKYTIVKERRPS